MYIMPAGGRMYRGWGLSDWSEPRPSMSREGIVVGRVRVYWKWTLMFKVRAQRNSHFAIYQYQWTHCHGHITPKCISLGYLIPMQV